MKDTYEKQCDANAVIFGLLNKLHVLNESEEDMSLARAAQLCAHKIFMQISQEWLWRQSA